MPFWGFRSIHWVGKLPGVSCFLLPLNQSHIQPWAFCFPQLKSEMISWVPTLLQITLHYFALAYYNIRHQPKCNGHRSITRSYKSCSAVSSTSQMNHIFTAFLNCPHQTPLSKCQDREVLTDEKFRCFYSLTLLASSPTVNGGWKHARGSVALISSLSQISLLLFFPLQTCPSMVQIAALFQPCPQEGSCCFQHSASKAVCTSTTEPTTQTSVELMQSRHYHRTVPNSLGQDRTAHSPLPGKMHFPAEVG